MGSREFKRLSDQILWEFNLSVILKSYYLHILNHSLGILDGSVSAESIRTGSERA